MKTTPREEGRLSTEQISQRHADLDLWTTAKLLNVMQEGQLAAVAAVKPALPAIARVVDEAAVVLRRGGRLIYIGAGTSGRIGVQDGAELTPTFDWPPERLEFLIAGGLAALAQSIEGAEDSEQDGVNAVGDIHAGPDDVVIAVAASGTTPFTVGALRAARDAGATTIAVSSNADSPLLQAAAHPILVKTGEEVIAGSTRMKAGTAQKVVLNLFSTALMVKLGRVYSGLMVDVRATNAKLRRRAEGILRELTGYSEAVAAGYLKETSGNLKLGILLAKGASSEEAAAALARHDGNLRLALEELGYADG